MKQIFKTVAVLALAAFAASCAKEQTAALSGGETEVSFTVSAPVIQTRAKTIADGNTVDKVACCVYDSDGAYLAGTDENPISKIIAMADGKATFKTRLVTGQEYSFIFWAYNDAGSHYTLDTANKTVTVKNYTGASNDESRDAFYAYVAPFQITGAYTAEVKLYRPFAQLNFGVEKEDITAAEAARIEVKKSKVTLTGLDNQLNLVDGTTKAVDGSGAELGNGVSAAFTLADCPAEDLTVKTTDETTKAYGYVAMNYILVGKENKTITDTKLTIAKEGGTEINTLDVTNVPLQGNYRTNVLGNLFTSQFINNIVVVPAFDEPDYEKEIWDGQTNAPSTNTDGNYLITKPSELAWVAQQTNAGTDFKGKTILLQNDIDLCNGLWTPIGTYPNRFKGTFDGQGHTISNLNVYSTTAGVALGLFGDITEPAKITDFTVDGAKVISEVVKGDGAASGVAIGSAQDGAITIEKINVKNAVVTSNHWAGGICGYCYASIKDCTVDGLTLTCEPVYWPGRNDGYDYENGDKAGGIVGYWGEGYFTLYGCKVTDATISGYRDLGGICGFANYSTKTFSNNSIENVTINVTATQEQNYKGYTAKTEFDAKDFVGEYSSVTFSGCSGTASIYYPEYISE